jgi:hypothetical protein
MHEKPAQDNVRENLRYRSFDAIFSTAAFAVELEDHGQ